MVIITFTLINLFCKKQEEIHGRPHYDSQISFIEDTANQVEIAFDEKTDKADEGMDHRYVSNETVNASKEELASRFELLSETNLAQYVRMSEVKPNFSTSPETTEQEVIIYPVGLEGIDDNKSVLMNI